MIKGFIKKMPVKKILLNDQYPDLDADFNGYYYDKETTETTVIYLVHNVHTNMSYIGRTRSYGKAGNRRGAKFRFKAHWWSANNNYDNPKKFNDCPLFFPALRESNIEDWFVCTIKVCHKDDEREWETKLTLKYNTTDPSIGYNSRVGNNISNHKPTAAAQSKKIANSNSKRAIGGKMKRAKNNTGSEDCINYHWVIKDGKKWEGYKVDATINGNQYRKIFTSMEYSMEEKLEEAKEYLAMARAKENGDKNVELPKGMKRKAGNEGLPEGISHCRKDGKIIGYEVGYNSSNKRNRAKFTRSDQTMKSKFNAALKKLELFKKQAALAEKSGSKTAKRKTKN